MRGNSGGFLDQAILIANEFLERGKLIVYTEDRNKSRLRQFSDGSGSATDLEIAVLLTRVVPHRVRFLPEHCRIMTVELL